MKRILAGILCLLLLCGCTKAENTSVSLQKENFYGIWITYSELESLLSDNFEDSFRKICQNSKDLGVTALFVHVRAFCDSIYPSKIFPQRDYLKELPFDPLTQMISICKEYGLEFHAWINPYRLSLKSDISFVNENFIARKDESLLLKNTNGLFLDPSSEKVRLLILNGIKEIVENYDIDGIHFDDYFYPTTDESIDEISYTAYKNSCETPLPLDLWRQVNVTLLISSVSRYLKSKNTEFTISPAADIEKNKNCLYADIEKWCNDGYIDAVIPQLYFGFDYPNEKFAFEKLLLDWINLVGDSKTKLYIGLAPYKLDTEKAPDNKEWKDGADIVARQIRHIKNQAEVGGAVLFSYSYIFKDNRNFIKQKEEISKELKKELENDT